MAVSKKSSRRTNVDKYMQRIIENHHQPLTGVYAEDRPDASLEELRQRIEQLKDQVTHYDQQCSILANFSARKSAFIVEIISEMKCQRAVLAHQLKS